jgi:hypothetical protein
VSDDQKPSVSLDPAFFDGRMLIDILAWDWNLRVAISPASALRRVRLQGLDYGRDFTIRGLVRAPRELRGKATKITLSPFGPKVRFGRGGLQHVGALAVLPSGSDVDLEATLMLPAEAVPTTATSLASAWKHLQLQTFDEGLQGARICRYFFHASIHPNLEAWANAD